MAGTLASLESLVLDEADKLLDLGFLEQCDEVLAACDGSTVQRCLFSATMPLAVEDLVHPEALPYRPQHYVHLLIRWECSSPSAC